MFKTDYIFETSWEVCNKVGGIYTVVSSKAPTVKEQYGNNYICIGPDLSEDAHQNGAFEEDGSLFKNWRETAVQEGFRIRIGHWKIEGNPIAILIDFTSLFDKKNDIFTQLWLRYKLDSISGQWDYVEPALFGYAAGMLIESFYLFYCTATDRIIAHFHEWMTGAGVLYLDSHVPQIGTVFTTHATVLGRSIAGNQLPLYKDLNSFDTDAMANRFQVIAKHSLEAIAAKVADSFTTVSNLTNNECKAFLKKAADVITINGFENDFVPQDINFEIKRKIAREKLLQVAQSLIQQTLSDDAVLVISSGRYEYHNKGLDRFIEGLSHLQELHPKQEIIAFLTVPAGILAYREDLLQKMQSPLGTEAVLNDFATHRLLDPCHDPILNGLKLNGLDNSPQSKLKVIFVPVYLNGRDGIFNLNYYDLLIGFDFSVFSSYYEPWGYTPLESAAFGIPTLTTSLAGFGDWKKNNYPNEEGVIVVERDDYNNEEVSKEIANTIFQFAHFSQEEKEKWQRGAKNIARHALWKELFGLYEQAYHKALEKSEQRYELYQHKMAVIQKNNRGSKVVDYKWKKITIKSNLPQPLDKLMELADNIWWSWHYEARELFEEFIGSQTWQEGEENPVKLLQVIPKVRIEKYLKDTVFLEKLNKIYADFKQELAEPCATAEQIAYFSMEYGLSNELKIFSGGLGMLAGDYLKEASDNKVNMLAIGLLYRNGYFSQQISPSGEQINLYPRQSFSSLPIHPAKDENDNWLKISVALPGRNLYARIWKVNVGRIPLYLMDTDFSDNWQEDRGTTAHLYGGDQENRLKQEMLLGIGGIRLINQLNLHPDLYHLNEGHAAFLVLERMVNWIKDRHVPTAVAMEIVRSSSLYTTHTPVPAGHDAFSEDLMRKFFSHLPEKINLNWEEFMDLGRSCENSPSEKFSMSILACRFSEEINGVSKIHGRVSREMFAYLYPGFFPEELPIGYVTNGVHYSTWTHKRWQHFHQHLFGIDFRKDISNPAVWDKIYQADAKEMWKIKTELRAELIDEVKLLLEKQMQARNESPSLIVNTLNAIRSDVLTIGFARRFATYKRAHLLFSDEEKLKVLVNHSERPLLFLFAGKAHPHDKAGQDLIKKIIEASRKPELMGKIVFIENYDMKIAKKLVSGCDIWLNTPTRPLEASGTSGEKAVMNGVLNFSVLDGWWAEGYRENAGWAIDENITYQDGALQDELDAATLYHIIEEKIAPAFYHRRDGHLPEEWVRMMKNNFALIAPHFTMKRQLDDYYHSFYQPLIERSSLLIADNCTKAHELVRWKHRLLTAWENIEVVHIQHPDFTDNTRFLNEKLYYEVQLRLGNIYPEEIKIELLIADKENDRNILKEKILFQYLKIENCIASFRCEVDLDYVGVWNIALRLITQHPLLKYDSDFNLMKCLG
jgi:phosphorylase/glycogen(starch) synthase